MKSFTQVKVTRIYMGGGEYNDNCPMKDIAEKALLAQKELAEKDGIPAVVYVYEHGGWSLGYTLIDGQVEVVYSANDRAQWFGEKKAFRDIAYNAEWIELGTVRRPDVERKYT
jgi:hypothetical protein